MKTIVISLERRKDRRQRVEQHLKDHQFQDVLFYPAFDGALMPPTNVVPPHRPYFSFKDEFGRPTNRLSNYVIACSLSHVGAIRSAQALNLPEVLIVEDDVEFSINEKDIDFIMLQVPEDWDLLYLGGGIRNWRTQPTTRINENILQPGYVDGLHAYIVRDTAYSRISKQILKFATSTDDSVNDARFHIDNPIKAYLVDPKVAFQVEGFSELDRKVVNRTDLR